MEVLMLYYSFNSNFPPHDALYEQSFQTLLTSLTTKYASEKPTELSFGLFLGIITTHKKEEVSHF